MIPVALPSLSFVLLVLFLLGTTLLWLVWTLSLPFQPARKRLATHWSKLLYALIASIALWTIYQLVDFKLQMDAYEAQMQAQFRPMLQVATRLGGIDMPAKTQLELAIANTPESFRAARFPTPVDIAGVSTTQIERDIAIQTDSAYKTGGFQADTMRLTGQGITLQEGWHCDASKPVEFDVKPDKRNAAFNRCVLAAGNHVAGIALPLGTAIWRTEGNTYTDGFVDDDRWGLETPKDHVVEIAGLLLLGALIRLTEQRQLHEVSHATLAQPTQGNGQSYPAGAQARFNARSERTQSPPQWHISAPQ